MLFEEEKYNSYKYSFACTPQEVYSYHDLCKTLACLTEKLQMDLLDNKEIWLQERLLDDRKVRCKFVYEGTKEVVLDRDYHEIHNVLCRKPEFKKRLEKIGIIEPEKNTLEFSIYLQFVYFFYILIYFVFPDIRFLDLFVPKNWSTENTIECDTGNEIYEDFIIKNLKQNSFVKEAYEKKLQDHDDAWSLCNDTYFDYYQALYDTYFEDEFEQTLSPKNSQAFKSFMAQKLETLNESISIHPEEKKNAYFAFLDFDNTYVSKTINQDSRINYETIEFEGVKDLCEALKEYPLDELDEYIVLEEQLEDLCEEEFFLCMCMDQDHATQTMRKKYHEYDVYSAIKKVWEFEEYQMIHYPLGEGFTFLKKEEDTFYMTIADCLVLAKTRIQLPVKLSYYSKRTYLEDRSDGQKKKRHSLKQSYKSAETENFDVKNSRLRDNIFRIVCRLQYMMLTKENPEEFIYYELPMNIQWFDLCEYALAYPQIEQKTEYYQQITTHMRKEIGEIEHD
ncbi:MAG: hypothetical protein Q4C49_04340 [Bacillota bacterium]|nr:hypothetical protein [Bacillota bacterium]